jgi:hypothetical protein
MQINKPDQIFVFFNEDGIKGKMFVKFSKSNMSCSFELWDGSGEGSYSQHRVKGIGLNRTAHLFASGKVNGFMGVEFAESSVCVDWRAEIESAGYRVEQVL